MSERIEHELHQLDGTSVVIVRPGYGTQSDSWIGVIKSLTSSYPIQFHFKTPSDHQIIFYAEDVSKVEQPTFEPAVVRLKGPRDYIAQPIHA